MTTIPTGYMQASARFSIAGMGGPAYVVTGHDLEAIGDPNDYAQAVRNAYAANLVPLLTNTTTLEEVTVVVNAGTGPFLAGVSTEVSVGANTDAGMTPQVAYLLKKNTAFVGKKFRGRMYLPGVGEASVDAAGRIVGDYVTDLPAAGAQFLTDLTDDDVPLVLLHEDATAPTLVLSITSSDRVATQRRRLRD